MSEKDIDLHRSQTRRIAQSAEKSVKFFSHQPEPKLPCAVKSDFLSCRLTKLQGDVKFMVPTFLNSFHIQADL